MTASNISRVMDSCETSGIEVSDYFREVTKMIETGKGARRPVERLALLEYAVQSRNKELLEKSKAHRTVYRLQCGGIHLFAHTRRIAFLLIGSDSVRWPSRARL